MGYRTELLTEKNLSTLLSAIEERFPHGCAVDYRMSKGTMRECNGIQFYGIVPIQVGHFYAIRFTPEEFCDNHELTFFVHTERTRFALTQDALYLEDVNSSGERRTAEVKLR